MYRHKNKTLVLERIELFFPVKRGSAMEEIFFTYTEVYQLFKEIKIILIVIMLAISMNVGAGISKSFWGRFR